MDVILLATDGTSASTAAERAAIELALEAEAVLHVLAVEPRLFFGIGGPSFATRLEVVPAAWTVATAVAEQAAAAGVDAHAHAVEGEDESAIIQAAERLAVELIVVGSHEPSDTRRRSVSRALATTSTIPVRIVRGSRSGDPTARG